MQPAHETDAAATTLPPSAELADIVASLSGLTLEQIISEHSDAFAYPGISFSEDPVTGCITVRVSVSGSAPDTRTSAEHERDALASLAAERRTAYVEAKGRALVVERLVASGHHFPGEVLRESAVDNGAQLATGLFRNAISMLVAYAAAAVPSSLLDLAGDEMLLLAGALERRALAEAPAYAHGAYFDDAWPEHDAEAAEALLARLAALPRASILESRASQVRLCIVLVLGLETHATMSLAGAEEMATEFCEDIVASEKNSTRLPHTRKGDYAAFERALAFGATAADVRPSAQFYVRMIERACESAAPSGYEAARISAPMLAEELRRAKELLINWAIQQTIRLRPRVRPHCVVGSACCCNAAPDLDCCGSAIMVHFIMPGAKFVCPCPRPPRVRMPPFDANTWTPEERLDGLLAALGHADLVATINGVLARRAASGRASTA